MLTRRNRHAAVGPVAELGAELALNARVSLNAGVHWCDLDERANLLRGFAVAPPPFDCPPMPMYMVWHLRHQADAMHQWLRGELLNVVAPALAAAELPTGADAHD